MIEIRPVTDRRSRRCFIELPYRLYRGHPHWAPPPRFGEWAQFTPSRNPFYRTADMELFVAWDQDRPVGRVAAIDDHRHNATHHENVVGFGFFEAEGPEAAAALLAQVERWAATRGRTRLRGPVNPSLNHTAGLQIDAFDSDPFVMMPCNPPDYASYIEAAGYTKLKDLCCWIITPAEHHYQRLAVLAARFRRRLGAEIRAVGFGHLRAEIDTIHAIYCEAWRSNWGFVPPTREEFWHLLKDLRLIGMLKGLMFIEVQGRPVACMTAIPDVNQLLRGTDGRLLPRGVFRLLRVRHYITRVRAAATGVVAEYREKGMLPLLLFEFLHVCRRYGFTEAEFSWVLEDNEAANVALANTGARMYKTYRLFGKPVVG